MSEADATRTPRAERRPRPILWAMIFVVFGSGGFLAWRYYRLTGGLVGADRAKTLEFLEEEKKRLSSAATQAVEKGSELARSALAEAKAALASKLAELEKWFAARKLALPSRKELTARAKDLTQKLKDAIPEKEKEKPPAVEQPGVAKSPEPTAEATRGGTDAFARAKEEFRLGLEHWKAAGEPGSPHEQEELALARKHFTAAQELLEVAEKERPGDPAVESLQTDCNRFLYDCMKRTKLDLNK